MPPAFTVHATAVAIDGRAVLLTGRSGAGKSDLALRLIDRGAVLIADDRTVLTPGDGVLRASAPATIAGRIEARGVGIVELPASRDVPVALLIELTEQPVERLPDDRRQALGGVEVPVIALDPLPASAPLKVELALRQPGARAA